MKIYEANIYDGETKENKFVKLAVIETKAEQDLYDAGRYDDLFCGNGCNDVQQPTTKVVGLRSPAS